MSLWRFVHPSQDLKKTQLLQSFLSSDSILQQRQHQLRKSIQVTNSNLLLFSSYKSLSPKTRALFGVGVIAWASIGLWTSSQVEEAMGMVPTAAEQAELDRKMAIRISRVDKE
jgi:hypothetical protein